MDMSKVNINELIDFHRNHKKMVTISAVRPPARFGALRLEGTKVKAMLDGIVTLSEPDLYYTGGTLIFDHGHGISTLYMHMQEIFVKVGQKVKQGDIIGSVGSTGRATGPHLDIRLNWFQTRLDPMTALKK